MLVKLSPASCQVLPSTFPAAMMKVWWTRAREETIQHNHLAAWKIKYQLKTFHRFKLHHWNLNFHNPLKHQFSTGLNLAAILSALGSKCQDHVNTLMYNLESQHNLRKRSGECLLCKQPPVSAPTECADITDDKLPGNLPAIRISGPPFTNMV